MNRTKPIDPPRDWQSLKPHPFAELCEFGVGIDMEAIVADMMNDGYDDREPLVLYEGKILNGRHRHNCAIKAEVVPCFVEYVGKDPLKEAARKLMQQHLDVSQRSLFAAKMANLRNMPALQHRGVNPTPDPVTREEAAKRFQVSPRAVDYGTVVEDHGTESLKRAVRVGKVKVSDAAKVARKNAKVQDYAVGAVERGEYRTVAAAATLCPRCEKRVKKDQQPTTNCPACDDIRKNGKPKKTPKVKAEKPKPAPEQQTFGWAEFKSAVTGLHAFIDSLGRNDKPQLHERLDFLVEMIGPEASHEKNPDALFDNERADTGPYRSGR